MLKICLWDRCWLSDCSELNLVWSELLGRNHGHIELIKGDKKLIKGQLVGGRLGTEAALTLFNQQPQVWISLLVIFSGDYWLQCSKEYGKSAAEKSEQLLIEPKKQIFWLVIKIISQCCGRGTSVGKASWIKVLQKEIQWTDISSITGRGKGVRKIASRAIYEANIEISTPFGKLME